MREVKGEGFGVLTIFLSLVDGRVSLKMLEKNPTISVIETDRGCLFLIITDVGINERHFKVEQLQFEMQKLHNISSCLH